MSKHITTLHRTRDHTNDTIIVHRRRTAQVSARQPDLNSEILKSPSLDPSCRTSPRKEPQVKTSRQVETSGNRGGGGGEGPPDPNESPDPQCTPRHQSGGSQGQVVGKEGGRRQGKGKDPKKVTGKRRGQGKKSRWGNPRAAGGAVPRPLARASSRLSCRSRVPSKAGPPLPKALSTLLSSPLRAMNINPTPLFILRV